MLVFLKKKKENHLKSLEWHEEPDAYVKKWIYGADICVQIFCVHIINNNEQQSQALNANFTTTD